MCLESLCDPVKLILGDSSGFHHLKLYCLCPTLYCSRNRCTDYTDSNSRVKQSQATRDHCLERK